MRGQTHSGSSPDEEISGWFAGRLPEEWFVAPPRVEIDRDEILVTGELAPPQLATDASDGTKASALTAKISGFREDTRPARMRVADEAQHLFRRKVSWGARCGDLEERFTTLSVPTMTRLRLTERRVLDTLVESGVARSRSHALAWCVRLVAEHQDEWLSDLREALERVGEVRAEGPRG